MILTRGALVAPAQNLGVARGRAYVSFALQAAVIAKFSAHQILNPAGSGVSAMVTTARGFKTAAGLVDYNVGNAALTTPVAQIVAVRPGGPAPAVTIFQDALAALGTAVAKTQGTTTQGNLIWSGFAYQLDPGNGLVLVDETANEAMTCEFWWVESPL